MLTLPRTGVEPVPDTSACSALTSMPEQFRPVIFWFFTYSPSAQASLTMCSPSIALLDVSVRVDIASGNLTSAAPLGALGSHTGAALQQFAGNVSGGALGGRAYNGMFFALADPDPYTLQRQDAIQLSLPAAVFQAAQNAPGGVAAAFADTASGFAALSEQVYVR